MLILLFKVLQDDILFNVLKINKKQGSRDDETYILKFIYYLLFIY